MAEDINNTAAQQTKEQAEDIMRQYDRESATRIWTGTPAIIVKIILAVFSLYCIWSTLFSTADLPIRLTAFLGFTIIMGYLTYPAKKKNVKPNSLPWYDILLMVLGAFSFFYYCLNYSTLVKVLTSAGDASAFPFSAWLQPL